MFERYGEQARDRKFSALGALVALVLCVGFVCYGAWWEGAVCGIFALVFGIPPFAFGKERFATTLHVLSWIGTFGFLG